MGYKKVELGTAGEAFRQPESRVLDALLVCPNCHRGQDYIHDMAERSESSAEPLSRKDAIVEIGGDETYVFHNYSCPKCKAFLVCDSFLKAQDEQSG